MTLNLRQLNPRKLHLSKWTAVRPKNKEKHFLVTKVTFSEEGEILECVLEAVMTKRTENIDWKVLENQEIWHQGWVDTQND